MIDLELVVESRCRSLVEVKDIIRERFARPVGKEVATVAAQRVWERTAGGFEVALKTDLVLFFRREPCRIQDGAADLGVGASGRGDSDVRESGTVAALAIDPFRYG